MIHHEMLEDYINNTPEKNSNGVVYESCFNFLRGVYTEKDLNVIRGHFKIAEKEN